MPVRDNLTRIVGENDLSDEAGKLAEYAVDMSFNKPVRPNYFVQPESAQEIQEIIRLANLEKIPVYPRSSGVHFIVTCSPDEKQLLTKANEFNKAGMKILDFVEVIAQAI